MTTKSGPPWPADKDPTAEQERERIERELREAEKKFGPKPK